MEMTQFDSIMLDLETMAISPNAAVIQIGARAFNSMSGEVYGEGFEINVDLMSSIMLGGEVHEGTARWWRDRGGLPTPTGKFEMRSALKKLTEFFAKFPNIKRVWAQGPSFDVAILEGYFVRMGAPAPWTYHNARDTRTVYDLARQRGWEKSERATAHTALADCDQQILTLMSALAVVRSEPAEGHEAMLTAGFSSIGELLAAFHRLENA